MKLRTVAALIALSLSTAALAAPHSTAFTYQGSLKLNGAVLNAPQNLQFSIYDIPVGGIPLAAPIVLNAVPVTDSVFTVQLDFGTLPQSSEERWLEIVVNNVILTPRQKIMPTPLTQASLRTPRIFGGQIHESPYWGGGTAFASPFGASDAMYTEQRAQMLMPIGCTARNLAMRLNGTSSYPQTTATLRVDNADTALSCQAVGTGAVCTDPVDSVTIAAGQRVSMGFTAMPARPLTNAENQIGAYAEFSFVCE